MNYAKLIQDKTTDERILQKKKKSLLNLLELKLFFNYLHIISVIKDLKFSWSYYLFDFFNIINYAANGFDFLFYFDCLILGKYLYF